MPSPFPGMDPYLEGVAWGTLHVQFIAQMARLLVPQLRPKYFVETGERFVSVVEEDESSEDRPSGKVTDLYPDVAVVREGGAIAAGTSSGIVPAPIQMMTVVPEPIPMYTVEIRDTRNRELVTAIEFLSPTNKRGDGRREYLERRRKLMTGDVNLMEIDFLRGGHRVPMVGTLPSAAYFVFLTRARSRPLSEIWPIGLGQQLPVVPVPLLTGEADVGLDLQAAFTRVYDECGLDLAVDYGQAPSVVLSEEQQQWARDCLKAAGKVPL
jgi:hypothetical protein